MVERIRNQEFCALKLWLLKRLNSENIASHPGDFYGNAASRFGSYRSEAAA